MFRRKMGKYWSGRNLYIRFKTKKKSQEELLTRGILSIERYVIFLRRLNNGRIC